MTYDEIEAELDRDFGDIDRTNLSISAADVASIQGKYARLFRSQKRQLEKLTAYQARVNKLLMDYYVSGGITDEEELAALRLTLDGLCSPRKVLKTDFETYRNADPNWIKISLEVAKQRDLVATLDYFYRYGIRERNNSIRMVLENEKYLQGHG
jgi:hypothetical protein